MALPLPAELLTKTLGTAIGVAVFLLGLVVIGWIGSAARKRRKLVFAAVVLFFAGLFLL